MASKSRPEPMNASPHHPKVRVNITLGSNTFVAGEFVSGKMQMESKADKGLGISSMMIELFGIQELTSRDHSATGTFLHSRRFFQGPGLPPSNAVQPHPIPGDPPLPPHYHQARRGISTFLFRIPIPASAPASINLGNGLATVRYMVRATAQVFWKGEKRLVTDTRSIEMVESFSERVDRVEPEGVIVAENGKIWVHGKVIGGVIVAGEPACVELAVKNHSVKKNTGLSITLSRVLSLPDAAEAPIQISDVLTTVPFRGPEYIIPPGAEGIASLVFDVPKHARSVHGRPRHRDGDSNDKTSEALFEVKCIVGIKLAMGIGSKDIRLDLPVQVVHPMALPDITPPAPPLPISSPFPYSVPIPPPSMSPIPAPIPSVSPVYYDPAHNLVWLPPPMPYVPYPQPPVPIIPLPVPTTDTGGRGQRASRISQHLRNSSRHRSVSPHYSRPSPDQPPSTSLLRRRLSEEPPARPTSLLEDTAAPAPQTRQTHSLPPIPVDIPPAPVVLYSPRPMTSPKHSYSHTSEPVQELERIAAQVDGDMSGDIPNLNKTLPPVVFEPEREEQVPLVRSHSAPGMATIVHARQAQPDETRLVPPEPSLDCTPPTPTLTARLQAQPPAPPAEEMLLAPSRPMDHTPPTPTLTAVTPHRRKVPRPMTAEDQVLSESGLDALERRLLAQVGTRKWDEGESRPDVRSVLEPIDIPLRKRDPDPLNDSAISSLSLAAVDVDDDQTHVHVVVPAAIQPVKEEEEEPRKEKKHRKRDHGKKQQDAKGRVAAWLGALEADAPLSPEPVQSPLFADDDDEPVAVVSVPEPEPEKTVEELLKEQETRDATPLNDESAVPNVRSSGFVPIDTFKRNTFQRPGITTKARRDPVAAEARRIQDLWSAQGPEPNKPAVEHEPVAKDEPKDEPKYNFKSARGGRGGQVTAIAAIWAAGAFTPTKEPTPKPHRSPQLTPKLKAQPPAPGKIELKPTRTRPEIKKRSSPPARTPPELGKRPSPFGALKTSVPPALTSVSHVSPLLSSTASLARPSPPLKMAGGVKMAPVPEVLSKPAKADSGLAFGQARLRDLIKKYQGQGN